ncbi:MAG TPA: 50S ribosomal protein L20 [Oligoflexia bacterium]|nr:50S ribosomal protein L20 [Oligoflexia bacterium]
MRVKRGVKARRRRNSILELAKGFRGRSKNTIRQARQRVDKSLQHAYSGRKHRKRDFRALWIARVNAACRLNGVSYSQFINGLKRSGIELDRKVLAEIGADHPAAFAAIADIAKNAQG